MKKIIMSLVMIAACALSGLFVSCDNREDSKVMAYEAQNNAEVRNNHQHPVEGEFANGIVKFRCIDSFYVDWAGQYFAGTHFCNSQYQILGAETNEAVAGLEGCYNVVNREVVGTELSLYFIRDEVEPAYATFRGINDPIDYSRRIAETDTCHYEPFKACFDKTNRRLTVYGIGEHGDTAIAYGDWYGLIIVRDTVRDTLIVHDTINHRDTITVTDTVFIHDSVETINTVQYIVEHLNWDPTVQLINGKLYVTGTDKVTKNVFANGVLVSTTSVTYSHKSRFRIVGFNNVVFSQSVDDCVAIVNGSAIINGHSFQIIWEADEIVNTVIVGGDNVTSQLVPCHATASQLCATADGHLVIHFVDGSEEVATYYTTYAVEPPTPPTTPDTIHVTGMVMFAGVTLSSPINTANNALTGAPEYHLNIVTNDNGTIRQYHKNINSGNMVNMGNSTAIGVTASTVSTAITNGQYPCFIYYNNCANTDYGTVEEVNDQWVVGYKRWSNRNANVTTINSGTTLHDGQDFPYKHGNVPDIVLNNANFTWTTVNGGTIMVNGQQYVVYGN